MIDFALEPEWLELQERTRQFVRDVAIPAEVRDTAVHGLDAALRAELQGRARGAGLFAPQVPAELGGLGLDTRGMAVVFEEAGYSLLGPQALNCGAPDEGNMHLLGVVATDEQRDRYLVPLAAGDTRSCFAMTEPAPGTGSDPSMLATTAERVDGGWSISGRKWFITGAEGAAFAIVMARAPEGATMFLVDADNPGWRIERIIDAIDRSFPGDHVEVVFEDCRVADDAVLGAVGEGFRYAQVRLAPARLTHCMRWLGAARRALDVALDRANEREAFGQKLGELGMVQERIAQSVIDIETSAADLALRVGTGSGRAGAPRVVGGQGLRRRGYQSCRRPFRADLWQPGRLGRHPARPPARRGPAVSHLRRADRDARVGHRPPGAAQARQHVMSDVVASVAEASVAAREPLIVVEPLEAFLDAAGLGRGPLVLAPIGDGHSNVTYAVTRGRRRLVLRRPPRGPLPRSAHDVLREARLLQALHPAGVRVPAVLAVGDDPAVIGAPLYIVDFIDGDVLGAAVPPALDRPGVRGRIGEELLDALVELHAVDVEGAGLTGFGAPGGYLERQVRRFRGLLEATATRPLPELEAVADWLTAERPDSGQTTVVHGDYRLGNVMFAASEPPRLVAILDWELAALGDPLADLGYLTAMWAQADDAPNPMLELSRATRQRGFGDRAALAGRYAQRTGRDLSRLDWYQVLAIWKSAVFLEGSYRRYPAGSTDDAYFARLAEGVPQLARLALQRTQGGSSAAEG
jgi:acyl-CoA dehydrogenase